MILDEVAGLMPYFSAAGLVWGLVLECKLAMLCMIIGTWLMELTVAAYIGLDILGTK